LGFTQQVNINGRKYMFNCCFVSGEVVTEPEIRRCGAHAATTFELAVRMGQVKAGVIKISCYWRLAVAAAKHLHQGDYVAVMGYLVWYHSEHPERPGKEDPEIMALDLEFVKSDSHVLGLMFKDAGEKD
jgi:single-strand DNA-binding protein